MYINIIVEIVIQKILKSVQQKRTYVVDAIILLVGSGQHIDISLAGSDSLMPSSYWWVSANIFTSHWLVGMDAKI